MWDLRYEEARHVPAITFTNTATARVGRWLFRGITRFGLTVGGQTQTAGFDLKLDPRVHVSQEDLQAQFKLCSRLATS